MESVRETILRGVRMRGSFSLRGHAKTSKFVTRVKTRDGMTELVKDVKKHKNSEEKS
jgi:hypothetical protein